MTTPTPDDDHHRSVRARSDPGPRGAGPSTPRAAVGSRPRETVLRRTAPRDPHHRGAGRFVPGGIRGRPELYWLDELYSVAIYGIWNPGVGAAVERLANTSVHPPLYQAILYVG